jgi:eukaryotic-like serine/threonine-protein kinase
MPDTVIAGRYKLEDLLGRGGMSEVYGAEDLELGRRVAIKLLAPDADSARFEREARAVAALAHPNVMQLYDYGEDNGRPYMVLEYVPAGTLEERLASADAKPLPDDETHGIAAGIAAGLAHAHARGVVHRDLKPANVLFDEEGRPKLADFGIARLAAGEGTLTEAGTVLGTAAYISPEQAAGEPATAASDVYSFGVILYRMLTGRLPFESSDPMELVMMNRDATPPPIASLRPDAPGLLESTATAALEKDPADRPRDGAALLAALGVGGTALTTATTALAGDATQVLPVAAAASSTEYVPPPPPPPGRSRVPLLVAGLLVLLLAGVALAYEMTKPASSTPPPTTTGGTLPSISIPTKKKSTTATTQSTPATTQPTTTTTPSTSTQHTTTQHTTTAHTTTANTTTVQTTTTVPPTTTQPPPTTATTAPPLTTTTTP